MRKGFGICCIILGICCLIASVGLIAYNRWEEESAQNASKNILQDVREIIPDNTHEESSPEENSPEEIDRDESVEIPVDISKEMLTTQVDGYDCIGVLSIPVLELELPILTDWSYTKLKIAPCHYFGSYYEKDFVIAAHNYQSHFGRLSELQPKDLILFTDVSGTVYCYEVVLLETLPGNATEEMITSGFDLSLYTCTPGGASRVTVRCNAVE
jgi:sortase A